jgi:hypothetical protein
MSYRRTSDGLVPQWESTIATDFGSMSFEALFHFYKKFPVFVIPLIELATLFHYDEKIIQYSP